MATTSAGNGIASASEQPQDVERRVVGPVQVLEHDDRRGARGEARPASAATRSLGVTPASDQRRELAAGLVGDVDERAERTGREQRLAGATEDVDVQPVAEGADQRGLADARLTGDQNQPAAPGGRDGVQFGFERGKLLGALQQRFRIHPDRLSARRRAHFMHAAHRCDCLRASNLC